MRTERGPSRGLPGPGWAVKGPQIDEFWSDPPEQKPKNPFDCHDTQGSSPRSGAPVMCAAESMQENQKEYEPYGSRRWVGGQLIAHDSSGKRIPAQRSHS